MSLLRRRMMMSVKEPDVPTDELDYLTIIPLHDEEETYSIRPCFGKVELFGGSYTQLAPLYYRINNGEWIEVMLPDDEYDILFYINLKKGDELQLKCTTYDLNPMDYYEFYYVALNIDVRFNVRGTPMSLVYGDDFKENNVAIDFGFSELFYGSEGLTEILNPKTFLPYTVLERGCYSWMFYGCTSLTNAPELPVTVLAEKCYSSMFYGCTSLTGAPELPATTLADSCYSNMFYDCANLNYIKMLATDISAIDCLSDWVNGVSSTGTFVKNKDATWDVRGVNGIPEGWTVKNDGEQEGGNDFGFEFPLYLEFDYCEENFLVKYCERAADELGVKVYNCVKSIVDKYGEIKDSVSTVGEQVLDMLGIEIYIENLKIIAFHKEYGNYYVRTNGEYTFVIVRDDGLIIYEL